jgi:hypothetical protein
LIDLLRALRPSVNFLQRDKVWLFGLDDVGDPRQIELVVDTLSVVNVVGQDAQAYWLAFGYPFAAVREGTGGEYD